MDDAQDPNEFETDAMGENIQVENEETKSNGRRNQVTSTEIVETMMNMRVELQNCRSDYERIIRAQEEQNKLNATMLPSMTYIERKFDFGNHLEN